MAAVAVAGCASVATQVTVFDQTRKFAPTEYVAILLEYPAEQYTKLALIEAQGTLGGSEAELLDEARKRARELGADAVVRLEAHAVYQPPVRVYDPAWGDPFYAHRYPFRSFYSAPYGSRPYPFDSYRWVGGGTVQTLKAVAIRLTAQD